MGEANSSKGDCFGSLVSEGVHTRSNYLKCRNRVSTGRFISVKPILVALQPCTLFNGTTGALFLLFTRTKYLG